MLYRIVFLYLAAQILYAHNDCPKWLPIVNDDIVNLVSIYDDSISERDFDCDGTIDTEDDDIDGDGINDSEKLLNAYSNHISNIQVAGMGVVVRILQDDVIGTKHQRFIVELQTNQTLLISHNIDLAPRINDIVEGEEIMFYGEYEWNNKGGIVHWTHHDPQHSHLNGWLEYNGRLYE